MTETILSQLPPKFAFDLCKTLNDRSVEEETAGITLKMTTTFPKFQLPLFPKKIWMRQ